MKALMIAITMVVLGAVLGCLVAWGEDDSDATLDLFLLDQMLREQQHTQPLLPPMPQPRFIPPIYLHQQSPCP